MGGQTYIMCSTGHRATNASVSHQADFDIIVTAVGNGIFIYKHDIHIYKFPIPDNIPPNI